MAPRGRTLRQPDVLTTSAPPDPDPDPDQRTMFTSRPTPDAALQTKWFHFVLALLAGALLVNSVPHFVNGISGNEFPTPFADPPTVGLSPAVVNVLWGLANFIGGYALLRFTRSHIPGAVLFPAVVLVGASAFAVFLSLTVSSTLAPIVRATGV